jgi:hypothetical protein
MRKLDDIFSGTKRFGVLSKLAKTLLVLPNSNADSANYRHGMCFRASSVFVLSILF